MRHLLFLPVLTVSLCNAQIVERCTQNSFTGAWNCVQRWNDTLWLFTGTEEDLIPYGTRATFLTMDTSGTVGAGGWFVVPGNAGTGIGATAAHDDRPAVIGGWVQAECAGPVQGFVARMVHGGGIPWSRVFGSVGMTAVADPDTFIHAGWDDQITILTQGGDSVTTFAPGMGAIHRMCTVDTLDAIGSAEGAVVLDAPGNIVAAHAFTNGVTDIIGYEGVGYALLSNGWLYRTDLDLVPFDSVAYDPVGGNARLGYDLSFLWITGQDSARLFDPGLNPALAIGMDHPSGYLVRDALTGGAVLMTCGTFTDGPLVGSALRSVDDLGGANTNAIDVRLSTVGYSVLSYEALAGPPGGFQVTGSASVYVVNEGFLPVDLATIGHLSAFSAACESANVLSAAATALLDPGDSAIVYVADIVDTVSWSTPEAEICLHIAAPMLLMDRDVTNDQSCGSIDVFAAVPELAAPSGLFAYPIPCDDRLFVRDHHGTALRGEAVLLDRSGRSIARITITDGRLDTAGLANGVYFLWMDRHPVPVRFIVAR